MKAFVFTNPSLARHAGRFVWLEIDTEKKQNAALKKQLGVPALPTYFVMDPADQKVALRWVGGFTVAQLDRLLDDGAAAVGDPASCPDRRKITRPCGGTPRTEIRRPQAGDRCWSRKPRRR